MTELAKDLPGYSKSAQASITKIFNDANSWMRHVKVPPQWQDAIFSRASEMANSVAGWLTESLAGALGYLQYLTWPVLVPIFSFFLLKDASSFEQNLIALLPNERLQKRAHWLLMDISGTLAAYIRAQITACLVVGSVMMGGLTLIGAPYPIVLGAIAGLLEFIPLDRSLDFVMRHLRFDADRVAEDRAGRRVVPRNSSRRAGLSHLSSHSRAWDQDAYSGGDHSNSRGSRDWRAGRHLSFDTGGRTCHGFL